MTLFFFWADYPFKCGYTDFTHLLLSRTVFAPPIPTLSFPQYSYLSYLPPLSTPQIIDFFQRFYKIFTMCGQASFFGNLARGKSFWRQSRKRKKRETEKEKERERERKRQKIKGKIRAMEAYLALCLEFQWLTLEQLLNLNK